MFFRIFRYNLYGTCRISRPANEEKSTNDRKGNRIGYGGGYYDKYFSQIKGESNKIVLAYDFQIVNSIENEAHDIRVNCIITNNEFIKINEN